MRFENKHQVREVAQTLETLAYESTVSGTSINMGRSPKNFGDIWIKWRQMDRKSEKWESVMQTIEPNGDSAIIRKPADSDKEEGTPDTDPSCV
jgi:hypothetical protein